VQETCAAFEAVIGKRVEKTVAMMAAKTAFPLKFTLYFRKDDFLRLKNVRKLEPWSVSLRRENKAPTTRFSQ
jgi:hypothetical protein